MATFDDLVAARKKWIAEILEPWCRTAPLVELKKADDEWMDIAGKVDADSTLWTWAWSRFPEAVEEGLNEINETCEVRVTLNNGTTATGYPDARAADKGFLLLVAVDEETRESKEEGPFSIDEIGSIQKVTG